MASPITQAIRQICEEKGLSYEKVLSMLELALAAAYRKDFGKKDQNIKVEFDPESGAMRIFDVKKVVPDEWKELAEKEALEKKTAEKEIAQEGEVSKEEKPKYYPKTMITLSEARKIKKDAQIDEEIRQELQIPHEFGRVAAQTAKQVIIQKLREAERESIYEEYKAQEGQIVSGVIGRREGKNILVDLGRANALFPAEEQIAGEFYRPGAKFKFYLSSVTLGSKGPEIIVSRAHPEMLRKIFYMEIPEIRNGVVEIKKIVREAGSRAKVAVISHLPNVDPIGACIGQRGSRIQTVISQVGGEKIDVIKWDENPEVFIANALLPAKVSEVKLNQEEKVAYVKLAAPDQLALAMGRDGQNLRLASEITGWNIKIEGYEKEIGKIEIPEETEEKLEESQEVAKNEANEDEEKTKATTQEN